MTVIESIKAVHSARLSATASSPFPHSWDALQSAQARGKSDPRATKAALIQVNSLTKIGCESAGKPELARPSQRVGLKTYPPDLGQQRHPNASRPGRRGPKCDAVAAVKGRVMPKACDPHDEPHGRERAARRDGGTEAFALWRRRTARPLASCKCTRGA